MTVRDRRGRFTAERTTTTVTETLTWEPGPPPDPGPPVIITPQARDAWAQLGSEQAGVLDHEDWALVDAWAEEARTNTGRLAAAGVVMAGYWDESWYATLPRELTA